MAMLLRLLDQPKCVDDAKVDEIRRQIRSVDDGVGAVYATNQLYKSWLSNTRTLLDALDAERAAVVAWLRKEVRGIATRRTAEAPPAHLLQYAAEHIAALEDAADAIERGEHRE